MVKRFAGAKPPRFPTLFEALVNAIACQQVTLDVGMILNNRLTEACGPVAAGPNSRARAFSRAADLADTNAELLRGLGFSYEKARALLELAHTIAEDQLDEEALATADDQSSMARLCEPRGIGRWSAEYVLLRGMGRLRIFPGDDVGARNHLRRWLGVAHTLDYAGVQGALEAWRSHAGVIYFHLLLKRLADEGMISA